MAPSWKVAAVGRTNPLGYPLRTRCMISTMPSRGDEAPPQTPRQPGRLAGIVSVRLAVGVAELLAALGKWSGWLSNNASPITSLGSGFIVLTPEWLKEFAIETFGHHDKDALRAGMGLTLVVMAAVLGLIGRTRPRWAAGLMAAGVAVVVVAVLTRSGSGVADTVPTLLGGLSGIAFGVVLVRRTMPELAAPHDESTTATENHASVSTRRAFFRFVGIGTLAAAAAGALSRWIPSTEQVLSSRAGISLPTPADSQPAPDVDLKVPGLTPFMTANDDFYRVDTAFTVPRLTAQDWQLRVHGMVGKPFEIGFDELTSMPLVQRTITLSCVSNQDGGNLNGTAIWLGARLSDLLARAEPDSGADCVLSTSVDGVTISTPLEALTDGRDALLAMGMDGEPLPLEHGFPVRMVVPGLFGYVSATKWVVDMKVTTFADVSAYWTDRGWSDHGPIKTGSRIDVPQGFAKPAAGPVTVAGVAWAQHRDISGVQVQIDDGPWEAATLSAPFSVDTWRQWSYLWDATPGRHTIRCRATDGTGAVQTDEQAPVLPDGATGYDSRVVTVQP